MRLMQSQKGARFLLDHRTRAPTLVHANEKINNELRMSLGLAKVAHQASKGNKLRTLKEAILLCQPVSYQPELAVDEHHFYFELLPQVRA